MGCLPAAFVELVVNFDFYLLLLRNLVKSPNSPNLNSVTPLNSLLFVDYGDLILIECKCHTKVTEKYIKWKFENDFRSGRKDLRKHVLFCKYAYMVNSLKCPNIKLP